MTLLRYTVFAMTPPSRFDEDDDHCCDCSNCWGNQREEDAQPCPYAIPQFCMICNCESTIGLSLDRDIQSKLPLGKHAGGNVVFWVCDNHLEDKKLLSILQKGVDSKIARNKRKLISYVRKEMEKELV